MGTLIRNSASLLYFIPKQRTVSIIPRGVFRCQEIVENYGRNQQEGDDSLHKISLEFLSTGEILIIKGEKDANASHCWLDWCAVQWLTNLHP